MRNITDRKKAEEEIRKLSLAVEQSMSAVMITDPTGKIEYVNKMFSKTAGYSSGEIVGKTPRVLKSGKHPKKFYENLWKTIRSGKEWKDVFCNRKKNGELFWELQSISPIYNYKGEIVNYVSIRIDDTEKRMAEDKLKMYARELERSNSELQDFAYITSHDLQEPLRKIIAFGDRLENDFSKNEKQADYLNRMRSAALRMSLLLENFIEFSQIETEPKPFKKVNLEEIVAEVAGHMRDKIREKKANLNAGSLPSLKADPLQMRQLFQNLISNALIYYKQTTAPEISITGALKNGNHEITVMDNGIGFDEKYINRIFKPFGRLHGKNLFSGTGMGLAICKKIVHRHQGSITAKSVLGKGSSFIIILPDNLENR